MDRLQQLQQQQAMMVGMQQQSIMGGNQSSEKVLGGEFGKQQQMVNKDNDLGVFDDGNPGKAQNGNPLGSLISLDSLTRNKKEVEDMTLKPIVFNEAAKKYLMKNETVVGNTGGVSKVAAEIAFAGVDGIQKQSSLIIPNNSRNLRNGQPIMNSGPSVNESLCMIKNRIGRTGGIGMMSNSMGMNGQMGQQNLMNNGMGGMNNYMMNNTMDGLNTHMGGQPGMMGGTGGMDNNMGSGTMGEWQ